MTKRIAATPTPEPLILERFLPFRIGRLANRVASRFAERHGKQFDLSIPEWRVLTAVGGQPGVTAREVVQITDVEKTQVSRAVSRLLDRKLLQRQVNKGDRRLQHLYLTTGGATVYYALVPEELAMERRLVEGIPADDIAIFEAMLDRLYHAAETI